MNQFSLSTFTTTNLSLSLEELLKKLYNEHNIMSKDFPEHNVVILYNRYNMKKKSQLEKECRSTIIDRTTFKILCNSCPTPIYNLEAIRYMVQNQHIPKESYICYEGAYVSLFFHEKWHVATRTCIYTETSDEIEHFKQFMDVLRNDGHVILDNFTKKLDKNMTYHFVLIHHLNNNIVNYVPEFGNEYAKLCFISARNIYTQKDYTSGMSGDTIDETQYTQIVESVVSKNIFLPKKIDNMYDYIVTSCVQICNRPSYEGVIVKMNNVLLKIQTQTYQFHRANDSNSCMYGGLLYLYQNNILNDFFISTGNLNQITDTCNKTYDVVSVIDSLFKVMTNELLYLFYMLYQDGIQIKSMQSLYSKLPMEYKNILYQIRGLMFHKQKVGTGCLLIQLKDIYNLLKTIDISMLKGFIHARQLLLNWSTLEQLSKSPSLESTQFADCLRNEKKLYQLSDIYIHHLFPNILYNQVPV